VKLRKLSRDDESEAEQLNQLVRMEEWPLSQRFDFARKGFEQCSVDVPAVNEWERS
jgi:hypothetical protein